MGKLSLSWLTENHIDFEYKKYTLLDYLQKINKKFNAHKLYPELADLIMHYNNLVQLKENKDLLFESFPHTPTGVDLEKLRITYRKLVQDDELMRQLSEIIHYAIPQMDQTILQGKELYEFVADNLAFDEVGLMPIYQNEGYVLLTAEANKDLMVYRYKVSLFEHHKEQFRAINTTYVDHEVKSITNTVNQIKLKLTRRFKELPNPATFLITSKLQFPLIETLLPIAKRVLMKNVKYS